MNKQKRNETQTWQRRRRRIGCLPVKCLTSQVPLEFLLEVQSPVGGIRQAAQGRLQLGRAVLLLGQADHLAYARVYVQDGAV